MGEKLSNVRRPPRARRRETEGETLNEHILQFFTYAHLPAELQAISKPFADLAYGIVQIVPRNPERTVALRKLLEAKDAAVRASIAKDLPA